MGGRRVKRGGRVTPRGGCHPQLRLSQVERDSLEDIFDGLLRSATADLHDDLPLLAAETWASQVWSMWQGLELVGTDALRLFAGSFIRHAGRVGTPGALRALRALSAVVPEPCRRQARQQAQRVAAQGVADPPWASTIGRGRPVNAWLSYDPVDDDGVSVMVGFDGPGGADTVGVFIDFNLGGIAKDAFLVPAPVAEVVDRLQGLHDGDGGGGSPAYQQISLAEAAARWAAAFEMNEMTLDPRCSEDLGRLRAVVLARLAVLPAGGAAPDAERISDADRDEIMSEFLASEESAALAHIDPDLVEFVAFNVMTFALDYVGGAPTRFSPVMVEIFSIDWAARKLAIDPGKFRFVPEVLAVWIRFVGRRRGIPQSSVVEAVEAVFEYASEMQAQARDHRTWGPAKVMALALRDREVDVTDEHAVDELIAEVNRNGGIDALAGALAARHRL